MALIHQAMGSKQVFLNQTVRVICFLQSLSSSALLFLPIPEVPNLLLIHFLLLKLTGSFSFVCNPKLYYCYYYNDHDCYRYSDD